MNFPTSMGNDNERPAIKFTPTAFIIIARSALAPLRGRRPNSFFRLAAQSDFIQSPIQEASSPLWNYGRTAVTNRPASVMTSWNPAWRNAWVMR